MRGFDIEPGSYFICTEASPRCYVIQQINNVNNVLNGVKLNNNRINNKCKEQLNEQNFIYKKELSQQNIIINEKNEKKNQTLTRTTNQAKAIYEKQKKIDSQTTTLPGLPWWFTDECRQQLLSIPSFDTINNDLNSTHSRSITPDNNVQMSSEQLRTRLKHQLEYYFSRENLINDRYLRCQMDTDQYVSIEIVAGFPKVSQLTSDYNLIVEILRNSKSVQVDETGKKVRPVTKRCTIILREIPENATENDIKKMFDNCTQKYQSIAYGLNNCWYVTFEDEESTKLAFLHLKKIAFNDKPVHARIKTGGAPISETPNSNSILCNFTQNGYKNTNFIPTCVKPLPQIEKTDIISKTNLGQIIIHDNTNNSFLNNIKTQQQNLSYLSNYNYPIELDTSISTQSLTTTATTNYLLLNNNNNNNNTNSTINLPSSNNLGFILAQYGYVPLATFCPTINQQKQQDNFNILNDTINDSTQKTENKCKESFALEVNESINGHVKNENETNIKKLLIKPKNQFDATTIATTLIETLSTNKINNEIQTFTLINNYNIQKKTQLNNKKIKATSNEKTLLFSNLNGQKITDVPRLNKDLSLIQIATAANFFIENNLLVNNYFSKISSTIAQTSLAFTDEKNFNALLNPAILLCNVIKKPETLCFDNYQSNPDILNKFSNNLLNINKKFVVKRIAFNEKNQLLNNNSDLTTTTTNTITTTKSMKSTKISGLYNKQKNLTENFYFLNEFKYKNNNNNNNQTNVYIYCDENESASIQQLKKSDEKNNNFLTNFNKNEEKNLRYYQTNCITTNYRQNYNINNYINNKCSNKEFKNYLNNNNNNNRNNNLFKQQFDYSEICNKKLPITTLKKFGINNNFDWRTNYCKNNNKNNNNNDSIKLNFTSYKGSLINNTFGSNHFLNNTELQPLSTQLSHFNNNSNNVNRSFQQKNDNYNKCFDSINTSIANTSTISTLTKNYKTLHRNNNVINEKKNKNKRFLQSKSSIYSAQIFNNNENNNKNLTSITTTTSFNVNIDVNSKQQLTQNHQQSEFNFVEIEFPSLANEKKRQNELASTNKQQSCKKIELNNTAATESENNLKTIDKATNLNDKIKKIQFSAIVAGTYNREQNKKLSIYQNVSTDDVDNNKLSLYYSDAIINNKNTINNNEIKKCSYAQTLKKSNH